MDQLTDSPAEWDDNNFEEDAKENQKWTVKDHVLFLIDASKPMFQQSHNSQTYFSLCVESCKAAAINIIKRCKNDKIGLLLFGTNNDNKTCPKYLNVVWEIKKPNVEFIKMLDQLVTVDETKFGLSPTNPIVDAVWYGNFLLTKYREKQSHSSLVFMSCCDQPLVGDGKKLFILRKRLEDVVANEFAFKFIPLGAEFNMGIFYNDLLDNFEHIVKPSNGLDNVDDIVSEIDTYSPKKRSVNALRLYLDDTTFFSVSLYNFFSEFKLQPKVKLDRSSNEQVYSYRQVMHTDTDEVMYRSDLAKYCKISNAEIIFRNEDLAILNDNLMDPGIRLLGFRSPDDLYIYYHFRTYSFIQPNEHDVEGSSVIFNSLCDTCLEMNKVVMCYLKVRRGGKINLAALIPQAETNDQPAGFHVMYLPFADALRDVKTQSYDRVEPNDSQIQLAADILDRLSFDKNPTTIPNPKIDTHWAMLEALALDCEQPKQVKDETLPDFEAIERNLSGLKNNIYGQLIPVGYKPSTAASVSASKRPASNSDHVETIKRFRSNPKMDTMKDLVKKGLVDKLVVNELKEFLKTNGLPIVGSKAELVFKVYDFFENLN
ncbi:X-ray repair cross-complementing protein 5-like [Adelges cooleyi]|uniref:X-ray repair cross-complementing protein 5-like n=1 Tax=Adelges cooleyi TaxID=133065 RepID=UPI00217FE55D|nr:X-ray repair cross-complementing protein 5-like [Adelges cooleyi]